MPASAVIYLDFNTLEVYNGIATVCKITGRLDSAVWYAEKVLAAKIGKFYPVSLLKAANLLSTFYETNNKPS